MNDAITLSDQVQADIKAAEAFVEAQDAAYEALGRSPAWIVCAANRLVFVDDDGQVRRILFAGARHCDGVMNDMRKRILHERQIYTATTGAQVNQFVSEEQGFIDQHGTYYTRHAAFIVAHRNNQIRRSFSSDLTMGLCSENLYQSKRFT